VRILLIRHAIAVPRGTPGIPEADRPLTPRGRRRFRRAARGLARLAARPDVLLTSPLLRARTTAELAARAWRRLPPVVEPSLAGESARAVLTALARQPAEATVALVGHEPLLSEILGLLLGGMPGAHLPFRKGGAALVEVDGAPGAGGRLIWFLPPRALRALRRRR
jgi:phosphohistidine phosphatase